MSENLARARVERSKTVLEWVDLALIVASAQGLENNDREIAADAKHLGTPAILVLNKADLAGGAPSAEVLSDAESLGLPIVITDARTECGVDALRTAIIKIVQDDTEPDRPIAGDLAHAGDTVVLVTPIDSGAPKGV